MEFADFIRLHPTLTASQIPENLWPILYEKLVNGIFDAGEYFSFAQGDASDRKYHVVSNKDLEANEEIFLVDHMWTYKSDDARQNLRENPGLLKRLLFITNQPGGEDEGEMSPEEVEQRVDSFLKVMWRYNDTYKVSTQAGEDPIPVWYMLDELGISIHHSDAPNCRVVPFFFLGRGEAYSVMWNTQDLEEGEEITRDYIAGVEDQRRRSALLMAWKWTPSSACGGGSSSSEKAEQQGDGTQEGIETPSPSDFVEAYRLNEEKIKATSEEAHRQIAERGFTNGQLVPPAHPFNPAKPIKVYTDVPLARKVLDTTKFVLVDNTDEADIIYSHHHYREFSRIRTDQRLAQFPRENLITVKDLLGQTVERCFGRADWFCRSYSLEEDLWPLIGDFLCATAEGRDNHLIVKPWNQTRSTDVAVSNNLSCILRMRETGPKIACKYIERPLLFTGSDAPGLKFDMRFQVVVRRLFPEPEIYVFHATYARFACEAYTLDNLDNYNKHFTVMNYRAPDKVLKVAPEEFTAWFNATQKHPSAPESTDPWSIVVADIHKALYNVIVAGVHSGLGGTDYEVANRCCALYGADIMIDDKLQPYVTEVNFGPDATRITSFFPDFYNLAFALMFEGDNSSGSFIKVSP